MAVNPISFGTPQISRDIDFASMGQQLMQTYKQSQAEALRREALASAGHGGEGGFQAAIGRLVAGGDIEGAGKLAAIQKTLAPETSADMQAYGLYRRQGGTASFLDFKKDLAQAGATKINNATTVNNTGEKEYDKALNKEQADVFLGYQKTGRNAANATNTLDLMEDLTKNPNFYSGTGGELVTRAKQAGASIGLTDPNAATPNEIFKSFGNKLLIDAAGGSLGAQISNADVGILRSTVPNIENTPSGNRELISMQRKIYGRQQEVAKMAREYASKNGGRIDYKFDEMIADYAHKNPLFSQGTGSGAKPAQSAPAPAQQQAPRRAPDGNLYLPDPNRPGKYMRVIE